MGNKSPATLICNLGNRCECSATRSGRFTLKEGAPVTIKYYAGCAPEAVCCSCGYRTSSLRVSTQLGYIPENCLPPFSRTCDRASTFCSQQRYCLTARLLSALKTPNVTDAAAASQKVREVRPTAILARNCEYCALGHLHERYSTVEFELTETNLNPNYA
jgi:hypothetical protein